MDEYENTFKRGLVQTSEIISSELSSRIRQEDSVQDTQKNLIGSAFTDEPGTNKDRFELLRLYSLYSTENWTVGQTQVSSSFLFEYPASSSHSALQLNPSLQGMTKGIL